MVYQVNVTVFQFGWSAHTPALGMARRICLSTTDLIASSLLLTRFTWQALRAVGDSKSSCTWHHILGHFSIPSSVLWLALVFALMCSRLAHKKTPTPLHFVCAVTKLQLPPDHGLARGDGDRHRCPSVVFLATLHRQCL